jgi:HK97 family phage major capsid protein
MPEPTNKDVSIQEAVEAVTALRAEVKELSPNLEKIEKINALLDVQDEQNQKLVAEQEASKNRDEEFKERLRELELELARANTQRPNVNHKESPEYKALATWISKGEQGVRELSAEEVKTLRTDSQTSGGYLVTTEMDTSITKKITEISGIRSVARVRSIGSKSLEMPIRSTIPSATYEGEGDTGGDSNSTYSNETLTPFRQTFTTPITRDQLMDSAFDMESEIMSDAAEAFAKGEGTGFVVGTGAKQPEGFLVNTAVLANTRESTSSGTIDAEDVILLTGDLKVGYDPVYVMNRTVLAFLRTLKSTTGSFLWQPGMNGPVANTLVGHPYIIAPDMPNIASGSNSIAFGDFRRGYTIIDRTGLSVVRDEVTQKKLAIVEFTMNRWNTGQVTLPEAIKLLTTKA